MVTMVSHWLNISFDLVSLYLFIFFIFYIYNLGYFKTVVIFFFFAAAASTTFKTSSETFQFAVETG